MTIRTARICRVPTLNAKGICGDRAVGTCMVDCRWDVCAFHFEAAEAAGFCPETWEQKQQRTIARTWANNQHKTRQRHVARPTANCQRGFSGAGRFPRLALFHREGRCQEPRRTRGISWKAGRGIVRFWPGERDPLTSW